MKRGTDVSRTRDGFKVLWRLSSDVHLKFRITAHLAFEDKTSVTDRLDSIREGVAEAINEFRPCFDGRCPH